MKSASSSTGTACRVGRIGNLTIYAKTGTAQTKTRKSSEAPDQITKTRDDLEHAWFVGYFYADNHEPLVIVMLLEHVGRSTYTTKVAAKFFIEYRDWLKKKTPA